MKNLHNDERGVLGILLALVVLIMLGMLIMRVIKANTQQSSGDAETSESLTTEVE